ncbi:MAG TPA: ABC transporter ATP-binding protein [Roseiflexaceae bacterium]|jgi:multiple sugar transport system ATP-binding protein
MATIELRQVEKKFGEVHAVQPMNLTIGDGEFVVLLGPSGCGKTTTLRMIAGLETVTDGTILLNGANVTNLRGRERDIAFVFQLFALYPHMTVYQNIAFPLQTQGEPREKIEQRVREVVQLLGIQPLLRFRPTSLSGGDRQRVALARALVRRPAAFLMDEPLGALDAEFREGMRAEIKRLHLAQHATTVYVTHDQIEAMAMGDRIVVMSNAVVQQVGTPAEVYHNPANLFVARFIGSPGMNLIPGIHADGVIQLPGDNRYPVPDAWKGALPAGEVIVGFRPEAAVLSDQGPIAARVYATDLHGAYTMLHLAVGDEDLIVHARAVRELDYPIDTPVRFDLDPQQVRFFDPETEMALKPEVVRSP